MNQTATFSLSTTKNSLPFGTKRKATVIMALRGWLIVSDEKGEGHAITNRGVGKTGDEGYVTFLPLGWQDGSWGYWNFEPL